MSPNLLKSIGNPNILADESFHSHVYWCIQRSAMHLGGMTALDKIYLFLLRYIYGYTYYESSNQSA